VAGQETRWGLPKGSSLVWREWGPEEAVVFDRGSGGTHLLDAFSAATLRAIADNPSTHRDLVQHLSNQSGAAITEVDRRLASVLPALEQLGLIEPVAPC
jgi:PqqD family protein of HPr-rel-A system